MIQFEKSSGHKRIQYRLKYPRHPLAFVATPSFSTSEENRHDKRKRRIDGLKKSVPVLDYNIPLG